MATVYACLPLFESLIMERNNINKIRLPEPREVLFEKYNSEIAMENFFISKLNGCQIKINIKYTTRSVFYLKNDYLRFQIVDDKSLYVAEDIYWQFRKEFDLEYSQAFYAFIKLGDKYFNNMKLTSSYEMLFKAAKEMLLRD